jgi:hypothetical protein
VKYFRPGPQFESATFDGLTSENPEPLSLGEGAVDRSDIVPEYDRKHRGIRRLSVEPPAGRFAHYRDLHIRGRFLSDRTSSTRQRTAPVGPVGLAKLTHIAVAAVLPQNGLGRNASQHLGRRADTPAEFLFDLHEQSFLDGDW